MTVRRMETSRGTLLVFSEDSDSREVVDVLRAQAGLPPLAADAEDAPARPRPAGPPPADPRDS